MAGIRAPYLSAPVGPHVTYSEVHVDCPDELGVPMARSARAARIVREDEWEAWLPGLPRNVLRHGMQRGGALVAVVVLVVLGTQSWKFGSRPTPVLGSSHDGTGKHTGEPSSLVATEASSGGKKDMAQVLRQAQGLCMELPGVQLGNARKSMGQRMVSSADECMNDCRTTLNCGQVVFSAGNNGCYLFNETTSHVVQLNKIYHSAFCGMLQQIKSLKKLQKGVLDGMKQRKARGLCHVIKETLLDRPTGDNVEGSFLELSGLQADKCFDVCRQHPNCAQATHSLHSTCKLYSHRTRSVAHVGASYRSAYCGALEDDDMLQAQKQQVEQAAMMRKAQGICIDVEGVQLASLGAKVSQPTGLESSVMCFEQCRKEPSCAQATYTASEKTCILMTKATTQVSLTGKNYNSVYCGALAATMDMKAMSKKVKQSLDEYASQAMCENMLHIKLAGGALLADLANVENAEACFMHCKKVPHCEQATFASFGGHCRLFHEASANVKHTGSVYTSAYCGTVKDHKKRKNLQKKAILAKGMRRATGICKEVQGIQLENPNGEQGDLAEFEDGTKTTKKKCFDRCRIEPGCKQAIFSAGNKGCYLFKAAGTKALHEGELYQSAFCGSVNKMNALEELQQGIRDQRLKRRSTGVCTEMPGVALIDGKGVTTIMSNATGTAAKCFEACRKRLGCPQVIFSDGNKGCYMFETFTTTSKSQGSIYHSAYCGDATEKPVMESRKSMVMKEVAERKAHGICFEVPFVRLAPGGGPRVTTLDGNATQAKCIKKCQTMIGCQQVIYEAATGVCTVYDGATTNIFFGIYGRMAFRSAFCESQKNWKVAKDRQKEVMKLVDERSKHGACIDLPGVQLANGSGADLVPWAQDAKTCVQKCRQRLLCSQAIWTNGTHGGAGNCRLYQNFSIDFSSLGSQFHSARCGLGDAEFHNLQAAQKKTLAAMDAEIKREKKATEAAQAKAAAAPAVAPPRLALRMQAAPDQQTPLPATTA
mmetsp:Transcript_137000/g.266592  ORF Transcript_137000/g.266592 Transcript_137000/m.266592 type:complete len:991 (+) Transcript_137000:78-3050(+)